jgi:hypothetical protein
MKVKKFKDLADDIILLKNDIGSYEKIKEPIEIISITGVITDEEEIKKIEENYVPITLNKEIKRGDIIWISAVVERKGYTNMGYQNFAVIKCRIVDYYYGMNALKNKNIK